MNPSVAKPTIYPVYQPWRLQTLQSIAGFVVFHHNSTSKPNQLQEYHLWVCANLPEKKITTVKQPVYRTKPWIDRMNSQWNYLTGLSWYFQPKCSDKPTKRRQGCCPVVSNSNHCHLWNYSTSPSQQLGLARWEHKRPQDPLGTRGNGDISKARFNIKSFPNWEYYPKNGNNI